MISRPRIPAGVPDEHHLQQDNRRRNSADIVYRDERVTCFRDANPAAPVHILIVPNKAIATINDLSEDDAALAGHMMLVAARLARDEGIAESGYRLIANCNRDGGQEVFHLHMHLLGGRRLGPLVLRK